MRLWKIRSLRCRFTQNWVFLHTLFLENEVQINRNNYGAMLSCQNKSVCQKLARSCKKWKSAKIRYTPFLHEALQLLAFVNNWTLTLHPQAHFWFSKLVVCCFQVLLTGLGGVGSSLKPGNLCRVLVLQYISSYLVLYSDLKLVGKTTGSPGSRCEELLFFLKKSLCKRSARETCYRDIVTAVIYRYITTLRETWLWPFSMWRCYVTKVCMGENIKRHFSQNFDIFSIKNDLPQCLVVFSIVLLLFRAIQSL